MINEIGDPNLFFAGLTPTRAVEKVLILKPETQGALMLTLIELSKDPKSVVISKEFMGFICMAASMQLYDNIVKQHPDLIRKLIKL